MYFILQIVLVNQEELLGRHNTRPGYFEKMEAAVGQIIAKMLHLAQKLNQLEKEVKKCTPREEFVLNSYQQFHYVSIIILSIVGKLWFFEKRGQKHRQKCSSNSGNGIEFLTILCIFCIVAYMWLKMSALNAHRKFRTFQCKK